MLCRAGGRLQAERNIYEDDVAASVAVDSRGRPIYEDDVFEPLAPRQAAAVRQRRFLRMAPGACAPGRVWRRGPKGAPHGQGHMGHGWA